MKTLNFIRFKNITFAFMIAVGTIVFSGCGSSSNLTGKTSNNNLVNKSSVSDTENSSNTKISEDANKEELKWALDGDPYTIINLKRIEPSIFSVEKNDNIKEPSFSTVWLKSPERKHKICIEGKGPTAAEEGIGDIYIENISNPKERWILKINSGKKQLSPLYVNWWDENYILVVVGNGYGHSIKGGNLYLVNINTAATFNLIDFLDQNKKPDSRRKVLTAVRNGDNIDYQVITFQDENFNKYKVGKGTIENLKSKLQNLIY